MRTLVETALRGALLLAFTAPLACTRRSEPCATPGTCPRGQECLANRCVPYGWDPVLATSERRVASALDMAVVSSRARRQPKGLPSGVSFGNAAEGRAALYLDFEPVWRDARRIGSAFLLLHPLPGTFGASNDVEVEVHRVTERWTGADVSWIARPAVAPPVSRGIARGAPPAVLRVDVTEIVRYWAAHPRAAHGLAVSACRAPGHGVTYATGVSGGPAPVLEIYVEGKPAAG